MLGSIIELFEEQDINYDISLFNPKNDIEKIPFKKTNLKDDESFFLKKSPIRFKF